MTLFKTANDYLNKYTNPMLYGYSKLGEYANNKIRNYISGDNQTTESPITPTSTRTIQLETYNSRYPWFDEADYLRLEQLVNEHWVAWSEKAKLMDEFYQYYYPQVFNKHMLDARQETINNWVYDNGDKLANGDKVANAQYRAASLAQQAKEKFDIAYNVSDTDVINSMKENIPNWQELLTKYLDTGDPEILYAAWIYEEWEETPDYRTQKEIANEALGSNWWKEAWANMKASSFWPLDSWEKAIYKWKKNLQNISSKIDDYLLDKVPESVRKDAYWDMTDEEIKAQNQQLRDTNKQEIDDYIRLVNDANQRNRASTVNPVVQNYYNRRDFTDLLAEWDWDGFFYKWLWDAASNRDMPIIIWASIVNPAMWTALMGTNSYVRESQDAYETMRNAWATHEQAEAWGAVVWLINSAIEVYLDKLLWWVETSSSKAAREALKKNVMDQVSKKSFTELVESATKTYVGSSLEEWLEEWLQNIVTNAAEMTVKENPEWSDLFKWGRAAAEGWIFNPMNLIAPWTDIYKNTMGTNTMTNTADTTNKTNIWDTTDINQDTNTANQNTTTSENMNEKATLTEELYSIDPTLTKKLQNNPYTAEVWQKTKEYIDKNGRPERSNDVAKVLIEDVADRVQTKLMEKMDEWWEAWKLYAPLKDAGYTVDLTELKNGIDEMLEDYGIEITEYEWTDGKMKRDLDFGKTAIDGSEASNIRKIYNWIQNTNAPMSMKEYLERFRRTLSDMVDFNPNGRDQAWRKIADTPWDKVLKWIRTKANELAHSQIDTLADLDKVFNEWVKVMDEVSDWLVYKDKSKRWIIRDNITQIIKNLDEPTRRQLANRLETLMPWIKEEVNAINQMPKVIDHYYNPSKLQVTIRDKAWGGIGSIFWPLWWFIGSKVGEWTSDKIDAKKMEVWDKVLSETSEAWKAKLAEIENRIENNKNLTKAQQAILDDITARLKEETEDIK